MSKSSAEASSYWDGLGHEIKACRIAYTILGQLTPAAARARTREPIALGGGPG
jgi:hypothetical protein